MAALDSDDRVGADLVDGDHEDPDPLPLLGRVLGDQVGAATRRACHGGNRLRRRALRLAAETATASFRPARAPDPDVRPHAPTGSSRLSSAPYERARPAETIAGFLAAASIFVSVTGIAYRPLRLIPLAIVFALIAAGIGGRAERLATWAVAIGAVSFAVGMAVAVITSNPLW